MSPSPPRIGRIAPPLLWIAPPLLLALFLGLAVTSMRGKSPTWDETHYLGVGAYLLQQGRWDVPSARLHPPLSFYLSSLPLLVEGVETSGFQRGGPARYGVGIARGRALLAGSRHGADGLLLRARLPTVLLGTLLGAAVFLWARSLYGFSGGLLSLFLFALEPNLLAHTRLATPDMAVTAFGFVACFLFWCGLRRGSPGSLAGAGLCLGLALLSKYSALLWLPLFPLLGLLCSGWRTLAPRVAGVFALAGLVLLAGYGFRPDEFVLGLRAQLGLVSSGREPSFLNGEVSREGWWYYYLYALAVKLPLPVLVLLAARALGVRTEPGERRRDGLFLLGPVALFLGAFSWVGAVNNGLRYVLPILPFALVWLGGLAPALAAAPPRARAALTGGLALLLVGHAAGALAIHPHHLAHFNPLVGGPARGYRHLLDSNLDWGQDLPALAAFLDEQGIARVKLCYFGTADPAAYGIDYAPLPGCTAGPGRQPARALRRGDVVAISATHLHPLFADLGELASHFRSREPEARIGYSIFVYRSDIERKLRPPRPPAAGRGAGADAGRSAGAAP